MENYATGKALLDTTTSPMAASSSDLHLLRRAGREMLRSGVLRVPCAACCSVALSLVLSIACGKKAASSSPVYPIGGPGCGLDHAAFCDDFEQGPTAKRGRGGDLDPARWSAGRLSPQQISAPGQANPAPLGPLPAQVCRASLQKTSVYPDEDTLICEATQTPARSRQLLTVAAMQNYGVNSYRIRQPFDFANRTGKIVFDVDAAMHSGLAAWVSVEVTEDPIPTPSFTEFEHGPLPKNGIEIQFNNSGCLLGGQSDLLISVGEVDVYHDYVLTKATPVYPADWVNHPDCVKTNRGDVNHFEIQLSQTQVDVYGSDASPTGTNFANFHKIASATYSLPFTRGYVHVTARNHATVKYFSVPDWYYYWDNVGFDGPFISNWREYEIPDSLTSSLVNNVNLMNTGYIVSDGTGSRAAGLFICCPDANIGSLQFNGVDLTNATSARLVFSSFYLWTAPNLTQIDLKYRFNDGTWRDRFITEGEAYALSIPNYQQGDLSQVIDVPLGDLRAGANKLELTTVNSPQSYPTVLANIDLVIQTQ
jgi:hypothetical protein